MTTAPSNVWTVTCSGEGWPAGVRGERLLERPEGTRLVCAVWELDVGARSPTYHLHHATEEMLLVLTGEPTLRTPVGERTLAEGDVVHFPVGAAGAHELINGSVSEIRYLMIAAHSGFDAIEYVDDASVVVYSDADSLLHEGPLFFTHDTGATQHEADANQG